MMKILFKAAAIISLLSVATVSLAGTRTYRAYERMSDKELKGHVWQMAGRSETDGLQAELYTDGEIYWEKINESGEFYRIKNDTIYWKGFNRGRRLGCLTENPVMIYTPGEQTSARTRYEVKGTLDATFEIEQSGTIGWTEIARGTAVLTPTDTLTDVRLTRMMRTVEIQDGEDLMTDTLISYRWYVPGWSLPIAVQSGEYLYVTREENIADLRNEKGGINDRDHINGLLNDAEIERDGSSVTIKLPEPLNVQAYIMDMSGNIYASVSGTRDTFSLSTSGLSPNTYVITIIAAEAPECMRKILLTL